MGFTQQNVRDWERPLGLICKVFASDASRVALRCAGAVRELDVFVLIHNLLLSRVFRSHFPLSMKRPERYVRAHVIKFLSAETLEF
jgi:hypothetical protein